MLTCSMACLGPWDSFEKHSRLSGTKGSTNTNNNQYSVLAGVASQGWLWICWVALRYGTTAIDMEIPADLIQGLLGSRRQLCNAFPSLWVQGVKPYTPNVVCWQRGSLGWLWACWAAIQYGTAAMDMQIPADLFHGLLGSMGKLCKVFISLW